MVHRPKRIQGSRSKDAEQDPSNAPFRHLDEQLDRILSRLADLLLRHGYGYQRIGKLAKVAFVRAAKNISKRENSRTSIARIAALTGLTRLEVSRLLKSDQSQKASLELDLNRATRVAHGWAADLRFSNDQGQPRPLTFSGRHGFAQLVRKFSGDIPARAMLVEMKRLGMVKHTSDDVVLLVRARPMPARSTIDAIRAIAPWVDLLSASVAPTERTDLTSTTQQVRIYFDSLSQVLASVRELENRRRSFVRSIEHLGSNSRVATGFELTVSIAVAAAQPKQTRRRKHLGDK